MFVRNNNIQQFLDQNAIKTRPNAGFGLWLTFLLPVALIIPPFSHPQVTSSTYKLSSIFSLGLVCSSLVFVFQTSQYKRLKIVSLWQIAVWSIMAVLYRICLHRGILFSVYSAMFSTILYQKIHFNVLRKMSHCFTLGEAAIFSQSYTLLLYFTSVNIVDKVMKPSSSVMQMSTLTIQLGLVAISAIVILTYRLQVSSPFKFYIVAALIFVLMVLLPLQIIFKINPLLWISHLLWKDLLQNKVALHWSFFSFIAVLAVNYRIKKAQKATTAVRKIFHFLNVVVFFLGLLYNCSLLYLASGVVLGIFFTLELVRVLNLPPLAQSLQNGYVIFSDEKDCGVCALTPMYLLAGCALPLWIHPAPCDVTNSTSFNLLPLLSGVLTTGVGDSAASIVGSNFGKHHWSSKKTVEGTLACIASQLLVVFVLVYLDLVRLNLPLDYVKIGVAVVSTSVLEGTTDQVDNLVLPFIAYIIFIV